MINIPLEFTPLCLLTLDDRVTQRSKKLFRKSHKAFKSRQWADAERYAIDVRDASQEQLSQAVDHAVALIYLSDIYRAVGRLGPAFEYNERAQQMLKNQPGPKHYHNRAVSDYALGLTHHALANESKSLHWYDHALNLLDRASYQWGIEGDAKWQTKCEDLRSWIEALMMAITDQAEGMTEARFFDMDCVPIFRVDDPTRTDKPYGLVRFLVEGRTLNTDEAYIGGKAYTLFNPSKEEKLRSSKKFEFEKPHRVVPVETVREPDKWKGVERGDLVVICEDCDEEVSEEDKIENTVGKSPLGDFILTDDGVFFLGPKKARIIGGPSESILGQVIAVLKPKEDD